MTLPLPVWCFMDGPLKGQCGQYPGKYVDALVGINAWGRATHINYKIANHFKGDNDRLVILAKMLPQQHRKWARIQRAMRRGWT